MAILQGPAEKPDTFETQTITTKLKAIQTFIAHLKVKELLFHKTRI